MTTSSFNFGSVPGISAIVSKPCSCSPVNLVSTFSFDAYRHVRFQQPVDAPVIFDCHHDNRNLDARGRAIGKSQPKPPVVKNCAAGTPTVSAIPARTNDCQRMLIGEKFDHALLHLASLQPVPACLLILAIWARADTPAFLASSLLVARSNSALSTGGTSRISPKSTIFPATLPLYWSKSCASLMSTHTADR